MSEIINNAEKKRGMLMELIEGFQRLMDVERRPPPAMCQEIYGRRS
ncbi:MAG: hypothetical protein JW838_10770 [Spirochaetes bacterium]|nr:hypothetical protein [Spirochaetota bacterium]